MSTNDNGSGERRVGVWIVGALGSVSALVAAGLEAMKAGLAGPTGLVDDRPTLAELEKRYIELILRETGGNKKRAAEVLGIDRRTLYRTLERGDKTGDDGED